MQFIKVYKKGFFLHKNPRPKIYINQRFKSSLIAIKLSDNKSWDIPFAGWLAPVIFSPDGKIYSKWKPLYFNQIQQFFLQPQELKGSLEIVPKLWYPNLTVEVWENNSEDFNNTDNIIPRLSRIEQKIDDIAIYNR